MLGLIKKDLLLVKANLKLMIIFIILAFQGTLDITFLIPLIGTMLFISTFSYDDFNNWNSYAITLPGGRNNVVKAKYIASIILTVILTIISLAISIVTGYIQANTINLDEIISSIMEILITSVIIISLFYPIIIKFGATNGRTIVFVMVLLIAGIVEVIFNFMDTTSLINILNYLDKYFYITIPLFSIILLGISYLISNKIYKNKEF